MYAYETQWYKKQQRQVGIRRKIHRIGILISLLFSVCFCVCALHVMANEFASRAIEQKVTIPVEIQQIQQENFMAEQGEMLQPEGMDDMQEADATANKQDISNIVPATEEEETYLIVIDAGHGGEDEGCSEEGLEEKDINLKLAFLLQEKLEEMGFQTLLTRSDDSKLELAERVELIPQEGKRADAFISIHQNSCEDNGAEGIETWYCAANEDSERLAKLVQQYTVLYSKARDRGIMESDELYVIRESKVPSCLIETGFLSNTSERAKLIEETYLKKLAQGIADGIELFFYPKVMYLTFDDGPSEENTNTILDALKEKGIKATFFVIGENVVKYPETAKRIVEEGHTIGIHCYNHAYDSLYANVDSFLEDFEKARQVVYEVTGEDVWCFRFPGGSINGYNKTVNEEIIIAMTEQGYTYYDWNASLEDAVKKPTPDKLIKNAMESTLQRKKVVMLAHDRIDATAECIDELIEAFPEYEMRPLTKEVEPIQFE